jgi:hypothetical protein
MAGTIGSVILTADGAVGISGKPVRVYSATWLSDATARDLVLRHGTSGSATIWITAGGTISKTVTLNFEGGLLFPNGCYFSKGDIVSAVFSISVEH